MALTETRWTVRRARLVVAVLMLLVYAAGAGARFLGNDWDKGASLHPDERTMAFRMLDSARGVREPTELSLYQLWFKTGTSPLDPRAKDRFFPYGELPHLVFTGVVLANDEEGWSESIWLGRLMTSAVDSLTILAVFLLASAMFASPWAALVAGTIYAGMPLALQTANFATVDSWLTGAGAWTLVAATHLASANGRRARLAFAALAGIGCGIAVACKLPGVLVVPAILIAVLSGSLPWRARFRRALLPLTAAAVAAFLTFRLANPFAFAGPGLFGLLPAPAWIESMQEAARMTSDASDAPPAWQWHLRTPIVDAAIDLAMWGAGPGLAFSAFVGVIVLVRRRRSLRAAIPALAVGAILSVYFLTVSNPALRYALPAAPVLAIVAAAPLMVWPRDGMLPTIALLGLIGTLVWGSGMVRLHSGLHSRVEASLWMWKNLPAGTTIAEETGWDEGLPVIVRLPGEREARWPNYEGHFSYVSLDIVGPDTTAKAARMGEALAQADVIAVSSGRQSAVMPKMPERFPMTTRYYAELESGRLCFAPILHIGGRYPVLFWELDDTWAQEPWAVYDHPAVTLYRKESCFDAAQVEKELRRSLPSPVGTSGG